MLRAYFFVIGLCAGSFANAVIWRLHSKKSVTRGRSMCPHCKHPIRPYDLIPVLSWLMLRGRCRDCKKPISIQYPVVELLTGVLFALVYIHIQPVGMQTWFELAFWFYMVTALVILSVYDLKWMLLPDKVLVPAIAVALVQVAALAAFRLPFSAIRGPLIAAVAFGGLFYGMAAVSKGKWMGGGDIKLVFLMGLLLGASKGILAMFIATTAAAIIGGGLLLSGKIKDRYIPFGPFLAAATIFAYLYGAPIINWYLKLSGITYLINP